MRSRLLAALCLLAATAGAPAAQEAEPLRAAVHIHSTFSTGQEPLARIAERARHLGLDVLVVSDDDLLQVAWGLPPWRRLLRVVESHRSLLADDTLEDYLEEIRRLDALHDDLIVIDGVESAPYYTWDVDWRRREWTVRGWNRHIMAVGLDDAEAYRSLPVLGGPGELAPQDGHSILRMLWPFLGLAWALWLGRRVHGVALRTVLGVVSLLFFVDGALNGFRASHFHAYDDAGMEPYQRFIDAVGARGGLTFWTHPEAASTIPPRSVAGLASVRSETPAHAGDLVATRRYTGFAALYADHITATEPGREWDRVLTEYLRGERDRPAWGTGEIDYHGEDLRERLHDIQTVIFADERSRRGVLEALARGRSYAVRGGDEALRLTRFAVGTGSARAQTGQALPVGGEPWRVDVHLDKVNGTAEVVDLRLIHGRVDGTVRVVAEVSGLTPLRLQHSGRGAAGYVRVMARSATSMLTSNPIFLVTD